MIDQPQILTSTAQLTAFIHLTIPREEIRHVMGPGLNELMATLADQGITPTGPWFTHHRQMTPENFDFEISLPVARAVTPCGRVQRGEWPARKLVRTVYHGGYEGLSGGWEEFMDWIEANGHTPAEDLYERYLVGPESDPDPAKWCTELSRPLV